ncbi:hypothetical protein JCM19236_4081 [Vibrio sp. JCM 19236]|nr:hypothetical protein JCM19236_4081 [Vibrio sp. JCM 19236]
MKKTTLLVALATLIPGIAAANTFQGEVYWNGSIESECGWIGDNAIPGEVGYGADYTTGTAATANIANNMSQTVELQFATEMVEGPQSMLNTVQIGVDAEGFQYDETDAANGVIRGVPRGPINLYATFKNEKHTYDAADSIVVKSTVTFVCNN